MPLLLPLPLPYPTTLRQTPLFHVPQVCLTSPSGIIDALTTEERLQMAEVVGALSDCPEHRPPPKWEGHGLYTKAITFLGQHPTVINLLLAAGVPLGMWLCA